MGRKRHSATAGARESTTSSTDAQVTAKEDPRIYEISARYRAPIEIFDGLAIDREATISSFDPAWGRVTLKVSYNRVSGKLSAHSLSVKKAGQPLSADFDLRDVDIDHYVNEVGYGIFYARDEDGEWEPAPRFRLDHEFPNLDTDRGEQRAFAARIAAIARVLEWPVAAAVSMHLGIVEESARELL